jgi:hypothetical protein
VLPVGFELPAQRFSLFHRSHSFAVGCPTFDTSNPDDVTAIDGTTLGGST